MLTYPHIDPVALHLGPLKIYWYGLMYLVGFLAAWGLGLWRARQHPKEWTNEQVADLIFYAALGTIIGGRLGYVLFYDLSHFMSSPLSIFKIWQGGMSFHGGLLGVIIAVIVYARVMGKNFFDVTDFMAPLVPIGLGAGRIGNFINGELWGRETTMPWGMIFPDGGSSPRHPSQLYEFFLEGVVLFIILWIYSAKPRPRMAVSAMFLLCYGLFRFFVEFFRAPDIQIGFVAFGWLTKGQLLCIPMILLGAFILWYVSPEAVELAYFGAKVIHPKTMGPVIADQIPIYIKNSFHPEADGTFICPHVIDSNHPVRGLTSIEAIALINIEGTGMVGVSGIAARVFQILHQVNISVILISQASSEQSICFAIPSEHADLAVATLTEKLQFELSQKQIQRIHADRDSAILAAVGDGMVGTKGIAGKFFTTLAKANINIQAIAQGSSERNISVVIKSADINKALRAVHAGFYLSNKTLSVGLIGPGLIGKTLLKQINAFKEELQNTYHVNLCIRGLMNSKKMLLAEDAIDLSTWESAFANTDTPQDIEKFAAHILSDDLPHAAIIDCTASPFIAKYYLDFLDKGIHVITPNKHTNAGNLAFYKEIKNKSQEKHSHYLYETTVCAGLPVITTLQDIIKTGDEVTSIEGVVSGTLSFIFNELAKGRAFSEVVLEAKKLGFTEPDPREDLSGMDVARKLVCLAREIGLDVSLNDAKPYDLVPASLQTLSLEQFLQQLPELDKEMAQRVAAAEATDSRLCYVCTIHEDKRLTIGIEMVKETHPFARLKGSDNMLIFHTRRYHQQPLVIQGPGAGAEVTAAGVFADLLRLVSFLA